MSIEYVEHTPVEISRGLSVQRLLYQHVAAESQVRRKVLSALLRFAFVNATFSSMYP